MRKMNQRKTNKRNTPEVGRLTFMGSFSLPSYIVAPSCLLPWVLANKNQINALKKSGEKKKEKAFSFSLDLEDSGLRMKEKIKSKKE